MTDSSDPFFLWQCILSEEDYFAMRREQSLVVDFTRFPAFLIGLFEKCQQHISEHRPL
jgi:spindle assembly abnormal protein 6